MKASEKGMETYQGLPEAFIVGVFPLLLQHPGIKQGLFQVNGFVTQGGQGRSGLLLQRPRNGRFPFPAAGHRHGRQHHKDSKLL